MDCPYLEAAGDDLMNAECWTEKISSGSVEESCALLITLLHKLEFMKIQREEGRWLWTNPLIW